MKVMDEDDDFKAYVKDNYYLADEEEYGDNGTSLGDEEDDGYLSDSTLPSEERDEADDDYFFINILHPLVLWPWLFVYFPYYHILILLG